MTKLIYISLFYLLKITNIFLFSYKSIRLCEDYEYINEIGYETQVFIYINVSILFQKKN